MEERHSLWLWGKTFAEMGTLKDIAGLFKVNASLLWRPFFFFFFVQVALVHKYFKETSCSLPRKLQLTY